MGVKIILLQLFILMVIVVIVSAQDWKLEDEVDTRRDDKKVTVIHPYLSSVPFYFFEGVDYEFTNDEYLKEHKDCYGAFLRCTRSRVVFETVCGLDTGGWYLEDFDNICQLELYNCRHRVFDDKKKESVEGVDITSNRIFYNGWDIECQKYTTRRNREEAIKLYLGEDYERIRAIRNEMLRRGIMKEVTTEPVQLET